MNKHFQSLLRLLDNTFNIKSSALLGSITPSVVVTIYKLEPAKCFINLERVHKVRDHNPTSKSPSLFSTSFNILENAVFIDKWSIESFDFLGKESFKMMLRLFRLYTKSSKNLFEIEMNLHNIFSSLPNNRRLLVKSSWK